MTKQKLKTRHILDHAPKTTKPKKKTRGRPKNSECQNLGCKLDFYDYNTRLPRKMPGQKKRHCGRCHVCLKGDHFPYAEMPGGANCHSKCYEKHYGPIDNARAITSLVRGRY